MVDQQQKLIVSPYMEIYAKHHKQQDYPSDMIH